ncbi:hypothetical protein KR032_007538 [Drosophila birchii]|nr:hypothetical protein KR032_007538 [Drosophila birchii]
MWSEILRTLFGPSNVPHKIQKLLQYRFLFALILGFLVDYLMLAIFLGFEFLEVRRPLNSLVKVLQWTMFSLYASAMMVIIRCGMAGYSLILCHIHYSYPRCYGSQMKRITNEFPIYFSLLCSIMTVAIASSWLYASFVDPGKEYFYQLLGCISGIFYFKIHCLTLKRFPLPIVRLGLLKSILRLGTLFRRSLQEAFQPSLVFTVLFWPYMESIFNGLQMVITEPRIFLRGWLVNFIILAKLHMTRELYSLIMQRQLPLTIDLRCQDSEKDICLHSLTEEWIKNLLCKMKQQPLDEKKPSYSLSLPISSTLDSTHLYGFRMLAARDFYAAMSGDLCTKLFTIEGMKNTSIYWDELREVLDKIINDFLVKMDSCLYTEPRAQVSDLLKKQTGIRSLIQPKKKRPQVICCCQLKCQTRSTYYTFICNIRDYLRGRFPRFSGHFFLRFPLLANLYSGLYEIDKMAKLNHVLQCSEPLVWILQGLVSICARSLKEDQYGILQRDLSWVFEVLIKVEGKLMAAAEVPVQTERGNGKLCPSHKLLILATNRCLFRMLKTFGPYLDFIVTRQTLKEDLERKMENLNVFQERF